MEAKANSEKEIGIARAGISLSFFAARLYCLLDKD